MPGDESGNLIALSRCFSPYSSTSCVSLDNCKTGAVLSRLSIMEKLMKESDGSIIVPCFVNAHTHTEWNRGKCLAERQGMPAWIERVLADDGERCDGEADERFPQMAHSGDEIGRGGQQGSEDSQKDTHGFLISPNQTQSERRHHRNEIDHPPNLYICRHDGTRTTLRQGSCGSRNSA